MKTSQPRHTTFPGSLPVVRTAAKALFTLLLAAARPLLCSGCIVIPLAGLVGETDYSDSKLYDAEHFHLLRPKKKRKK